MGRFRFFIALSKCPKLGNCLLNSQSFAIKSISTSLQRAHTQTLTPTSSQRTSNSHPSLLHFHFIISRSIHDDSNQPQLIITDNKTQQVISDKSIGDTEKIITLLSKNFTSNAEKLLGNANVEVSPELVFEVLKKLSNAGVIALCFFRWAEKQKGFKFSTESYNALIDSLGKIKQFKKIWSLVDEMKQKRLLTKDTFALISRRYARAKRVREAIGAFEKMMDFGLSLESSDYNRLLDVLSKSRQVERAQEVFDKMKKRGFSPNIKSYTILLEGWGQEKNLLRLDEVYREMIAEGFEPDVVAYGIIINAYCKAGKYDVAIQVFNEMEVKNCKPTPHIFCTLINGLGSVKRLREALSFFEISKASGLALEAPTYNAVVGAYCWSMRMDDAHRMVKEMRKCGVGPNARTYDILLHHLIKAQRNEEAYSIFRKMSSEEGCEPTLSTYEIIVRLLCNEKKFDIAIQVWDQMKAKGVLPGMHLFCTLINSLCDEKKFDGACKYFQEMLDIGIRPPAKLFGDLKQALVENGMKDDALGLAQKIDKLRKTTLVG